MNKEFMRKYKSLLLDEFKRQDRKGLYSYVQKSMAYNSNRIEGSTLTSEQTASLFDTGTLFSFGEVSFKAKDIEEMNGHFKMFNEVLKNLDKELSVEMIKSFHYQLKSGVFEDYANGYPVGEFKSRPNLVSDIITAMPNEVDGRIRDLLDRYNNGNRELMDMVKFHAEYESIHPFQDGNGRTGRAILLKQCLDSDIVPVIIKDEDKAKYAAALHRAQVENDYSALYNVFKEQQEKHYENIKCFI